MALFKVNTGCREEEVCSLKWDYEVKVPELDTSVFIIPGDKVKNAQDRLVVLNRVAKSVCTTESHNFPTIGVRGLSIAVFVASLTQPITDPVQSGRAAHSICCTAFEKEMQGPGNFAAARQAVAVFIQMNVDHRFEPGGGCGMLMKRR
jgi:hypothetical protein